MSIAQIFNRLQKYQSSQYAQRILPQLRYAYQISQANDHSYDCLIESAASRLLEDAQDCGAITKAAAMQCEQSLLPMERVAKSLRVFCVSHAHIDMNWMWGFHETVAITLDTFRTVLRLMEEYPDFVFSQSQASTYRIVETYEPELFRKIQERVAQGRWEVTASTWVEADKNMADSESMARQIVLTKKYFREKFNICEDALLLDFEPDTFGHSRFVPEILQHGGVQYLYHCRGDQPEHGKDIYYWNVPSGKKILVYREPDWYNGAIAPEFLENVPQLCHRNGISSIMKVYGVGDHGGGPTRADIEMLKEMQQWPIAPSLQFSTYAAYFRQLEEELKDVDVPVVSEELNYVFTGCYSSQARLKAANRRAERTLYASETATALVNQWVGQEHYDYDPAWENTLFNQFHDILPGSGVGETRDYALGLAQQTMAYAYAGRSKALLKLSAALDTSAYATPTCKDATAEGAGVGFHGDANLNSGIGQFGDIQMAARGSGDVRIYHVFNPTQFDRREIAEVTVWDYVDGGSGEIVCLDAEDHAVPIELTQSGNYWAHTWQKVLIPVDVPAFGYTTYVFKKSTEKWPVRELCKEPRIEVYSPNVLKNEHIRAEFDDQMQLVRLIDLHNGENLISEPSAYFTLALQNHIGKTVFPGNAWVEGYTVNERNLNCEGNVFITQKPSGLLRQTLCGTIAFEKSTIKLEIRLDQGARALEYVAQIDWHEDFDPKSGIPALRLRIPVGKEIETYTYKIPFGYLQREAKHHDVPAIGCALAQTKTAAKEGIALLSDSCYAFRGEENMLGMTLLRSSQDPDPHPEKGLYSCRFAIGLCKNDMTQLSRMDATFANPLHIWTDTAHKGELPLTCGLLKLEGEATISTIKQAEDDSDTMVIRLFRHCAEDGEITIRLSGKYDITQADLLERPIEQMQKDRDEISLTLRAGEVITLRLKKTTTEGEH